MGLWGFGVLGFRVLGIGVWGSGIYGGGVFWALIVRFLKGFSRVLRGSYVVHGLQKGLGFRGWGLRICSFRVKVVGFGFTVPGFGTKV